MEWQPQPYHWISFCIAITVLLSCDLLLFHRKQKEESLLSATLWTIFWCCLAMSYNFLIYTWAGKDKALEFFTGYIVEWSLSLDNVFVFAVVFNFFKVPLKNQHRVLFWGILGAVVMRFIFIFIGSALLREFAWIMSVFGFLLIFTGFKMLRGGNEELNPEDNFIVKLSRKFLPVHPKVNNDHFFVRENGKLYVTSLFLVLLVIESTDVLFAVDSVPAIFGITRDPFIVFTSNIAAILGLRSLYFMLAGVMDLFKYLNYGLSAILIFVGVKMNLEFWYPHEPGTHLITPGQSLAVIGGVLAISIIASVIAARSSKAS